MDDKRREADLNLIQALLSSSSGDIPDLLKTNQDLIDIGLLQTMEQIAVILDERVDGNQAVFLRNIAAQLAAQVGLVLPNTRESDSSFALAPTFLAKVLQVTLESNGDREVIYNHLIENLNQIDEQLAQKLRAWGMATLREIRAEEAQSVTKVVGNFSNRIRDFPLGDIASNLEIAIAGYEVVATIYTRENFPIQWATNQNNLGIAYCQRIKGDRQENLEMAIRCYQRALLIRTSSVFPAQWAKTQNNLGLAYLEREQGNRSENIEIAIRCYESVLQIRTHELVPWEWAMTQNYLGIAYLQRLQGNRAENVEMAIKCLNHALTVYTIVNAPENWATSQSHLANAYLERRTGDRGANLEQGIVCIHNALKIYNMRAFPQDWANCQKLLATMYIYRHQGKHSDNWETAIACYENALQVYTLEKFPQQWAGIQTKLAALYRQRHRGHRVENLEKAIAYYQATLQVYNYEKFPQQWAKVQNHLGTTYIYRIHGDRSRNFQLAIAAYEKALTIYTLTTFPQDYAQTLFNLGLVYKKAKQFQSAYNALESAIAAVEFLREQISSNQSAQQKLSRRYAKLYRYMVEVCLELRKNQPQYYVKAIEYTQLSQDSKLKQLLDASNNVDHTAITGDLIIKMPTPDSLV